MAKRNPNPRISSGRHLTRLMSGTLAVIMAGGRGERMRDLTANRCKPATPFGGKFRIIDFPLSNCVNSGIRKIFLMTQYKGQSLIQHVQRGWSYLRGELGEFVDVVPAQQQIGEHWYRGSADCVYQNLDLIRAHQPKHVLVLAGDHIYKMDYGPLVAYHVDRGADITIGVVEVARDKAREFGVLSITEGNRVTRFTEKPNDPEPVPGRADTALASMGIYVFTARLLDKLLTENAELVDSKHDFGRDIIPRAIETLRVYAYPFTNVKTQAQNYWRDVGTVDAYYEANIELVHVAPELNLYDEEWPIWTYQLHQPAAKFVLDEDGRRGMAINSIVSGACIISGAVVNQSLLFSNVHIDERSSVFRSVVLPYVKIGRGCTIRQTILDEGCVVPDGTQIGVDREADAARFHVTAGGVILVVPEMLRRSHTGA